ncbi:bifunctional glutamate N-acetyltransferase/amino-acid acetyltransferase ArgJ [Thiohalobacter sp. IOR34]|uniref:bifunctional glutamate N-acetyltransferase/amino-acid acetyltransferase ArgJ n=1 Tax=Thiohalobacter sp. IOR34 TaxID=3057176 RepID=UPI0025B14F92|nr:bifunctional glutamate N-acetyltransferase/amino-acid acetyltransferase ArgJ [Thiohalobacter sp. IOR34]WJW74942.1 bifunctional glutamate N-acetyltransferase/amino-acid acetyltransferase ArgJ [Thiohalobacter sp. IOR34]
MAVGLKTPTHLHPVAGIRLGTVQAGIRYPDRRDLVLMEIAEGATSAAVFTRNAFCAAPVRVAREHLQRGEPRYLLINTGNANAGTGETGLRDARESCAVLARETGCSPTEVLPFSTGVIGEPLPMDRLLAGIPRTLEALEEDAWLEAAHGILTTDTLPKGGSRRIEIDGQPLTLTGIAKGAGMIRPDMATMLCFVATDARIDRALLQQALNQAVDASFNRITVDGDTSTNDACMLVASGRGGARIDAAGPAYDSFAAALRELCIELAQAIVRDGEGATKFVTVEVGGGRDTDECLQVAYTIAHSPLVKTALFASDPNWGRILAAIGRAGLDRLDIDAVQVFLGDVCIVRQGGRAPDYTEDAGAAVMAEAEILIRIELGRGSARERIWTTDLSYDYVRINAEYRT